MLTVRFHLPLVSVDAQEQHSKIRDIGVQELILFVSINLYCFKDAKASSQKSGPPCAAR
jgi:hypothetical protein